MSVQYEKSFPASMNQTCAVIVWPGMSNGDDGVPFELAQFPDRSVQVSGDFGVGGNLRIEGSLDGVNYYALSDPQGNDLNFVGGKIEAITELVRYLRPRVTAGDGSTSLTVTMLARG